MGKVKAFWEGMGKYFPPGYEYERERAMAVVLLTGGGFLSLRFLWRLREAWESLYYWNTNTGRQLRPEIVAESFLELWARDVWLFAPLYLFLAVMAVEHYFYYSRGAKSLYLMRRLPKKGVLVKSCVQMPLLGMAAGAAVTGILGLVYFGVYLLVMPDQCRPRLL